MTGKLRGSTVLAATLAGLIITSAATGQTVQSLISAEAARIEQARAQQDQIDEIVRTTRARFDEYQGLLKEIDGLLVYNNLLQAQIDDQNAQLDELRRSIDQVSVIERQMLPLMTRMIAALEQFIKLDMPFLVDERLERVELLKDTLNRSDVTAAVQFRTVMDAWQREMTDYGRNSEVYVDVIEVDGRQREVELLRIGRIALLYVTPDGSQAGAWDRTSGQWVQLDGDMSEQILTGIEAVESGEPALFTVPVAPPEEG